MEWLVNNLGIIIWLVLTILSGVVSFIITYKTKGANSAVLSAMQVVNKMLPSLITTSENINTGKAGEAKKAYVMTFVETMLAGRGISLTESLKAEISDNIDAIVFATKNMHVGAAQNEKNQRNDLDGVTGLRSNS